MPLGLFKASYLTLVKINVVLTTAVSNRFCKEDTSDYFCPPTGGSVWCVQKLSLLG